MSQPESNGLFELSTAKPIKERGFNCMRLIVFLTEESITEWDEWHGAHIKAANGMCPYTSRCSTYERTMEEHRKENLQLTINF